MPIVSSLTRHPNLPASKVSMGRAPTAGSAWARAAHSFSTADALVEASLWAVASSLSAPVSAEDFLDCQTRANEPLMTTIPDLGGEFNRIWNDPRRDKPTPKPLSPSFR
jgi:hypothetical protein